MALEASDLNGDGWPDYVASNNNIYIIDGHSHGMRASAGADYKGLAVADINHDGAKEILAGMTNGFLAVVDPSSLNVTASYRVCSSDVNSVKFGQSANFNDAVIFSCNDSIGIFSLTQKKLLWSSGVISDSVGLYNNLQVYDVGAKTRIVAGHASGLFAYEYDPGDFDSDGVMNASDNCPNDANPNQLDSDGNGIGNVCDIASSGDVDSDGIGDNTDNCRTLPTQTS